MSVDNDFYSLIYSVIGSSGFVQQNLTSENVTIEPRIWFQRQSGNTELFLNGTPAIKETVYTVEVIGKTLVNVRNVADAVTVALHGYRGAMGSGFAQGIFVQDADDDYVAQAIDADTGEHVMAFSVRILQ